MKRFHIPLLTWQKLPRSCFHIATAMTLLALSGCLGRPYVRLEKASLCMAEPGTAWTGDGTDVVLERDGVRYHVQIADRGQLDDNPTYWVQLAVESSHGTRVDGRYVPGKEKMPMIYDPKDAWIEVNGKRTAALPKLWKRMEASGGLPRPGPEMPVPANVNPQNGILYNDVFIGFDIPAPLSRDKYRLSPGSITIGGVATPLPVFDSCFSATTAGWNWVRC
jgi:hypothetical protein